MSSLNSKVIKEYNEKKLNSKEEKDKFIDAAFRDAVSDICTIL